MKVFRNFQKFRLFWHGRTELTEVQGRYKNALLVPLVMWQSYRIYERSGYGCECTELTEVICTGMDVVQNSQKLYG